MCSTTRGPAIWPSSSRGRPARPPCPSAWRSGSSPARRCGPAVTVPGAESTHVAPKRLDRIDDDEVRALALGKRREDIFDIRLGPQEARRCRRRQPLSTQAEPGRSLLRPRHRSPDASGGQVPRPPASVRSTCRYPDLRRRAVRIRERSRRRSRDRVRKCRCGCAARLRSLPDSVVVRRDAPFFGVRMGPPPIPPVGSSSMIVFHSPQPSHLPTQREWTVPPFWQTNWVRAFAMDVLSDVCGGWRNCRRPRITLGGHIMPRNPD